MPEPEESACLQELVGKPLESVTFVVDYVRFQFLDRALSSLSYPTLRINGQAITAEEFHYRNELCALIGQTATAAADEGDTLKITLSNSAEILVPLMPEPGYSGEMATMSLTNGVFQHAWLSREKREH